MKTRRITPLDDTVFKTCVELPDGREVSFFLNTVTSLIVVDVIDADEKGGIEVFRGKV